MSVRFIDYLDSYRAFGLSLELRNPQGGSLSASVVIELLLGKIEINIGR